MPKESKTISHHNKQPYPESSTQQTNAKKNVEFVWESYEQQSPVKSKQHFPSPSNSSGGMTQLLGFQEDDPMNGFSFSTPSTSGELMNPFPTSDSDLKLSPPNTTTTAEDPFKKHNDLSSLTSASFHIACTACREKHIKCDKKLPHCTYCIKHGLTCQYRKPKKRGRPSTKNKNGQSTEDDVSEMNCGREPNRVPNAFADSNSTLISTANQNFQMDEFAQNSGDMTGWFFNQQQNLKQPQADTQLTRIASSSSTNPIMINDTEIDVAGFSQMPHVDFNNESLIALIRMSRDLNKQLMKRLTVDDYYRSTSMPLIDQRSVEQIFFSEKRSAEANCFLYSIHMLMCQRRGFKEESERAYEKTRAMLSSVFDQWRSFLTACTYCNLSIYCSGEGNDADAVFYLSFVDYYFSQLKEKFSLGQQNLRYLKSIAEMAAGVGVCSEKPIYDELAEVDAESLSKQCHHDVANLLVGFYKYTTGKKKVPPELLQITSQTINQDTIFLYLTLFDMITKLVTQHEANRQKSLTPEQEEISKAICDAFINGTRVLILQQCGYKGKVLEDAANRIAEIFSNEISIGFASPLYMSSVIATCQVHIAIIEEIESGARSNFEFGVDYYSMIDKDIKAMNYLEKQFGRVRKRYSQIIYRLESIKRRREMEVSKLVVNEIERLKSMRNGDGKINFDKSFLSQEHLSSIYSLFHNNNGEASTSNNNQQPIFINIPTENIPQAASAEVPNFGRNLEDSFDDILNNL